MLVWMIVLCMTGVDKDTAPFAPSVWEIGVDEARGIYDAAVVSDVTTFTSKRIHRKRVVRIFSEAGRSAADISALGTKLRHVSGTVYTRTGAPRTFDSDSLVETLAYKHRGRAMKATILLPPGLSRDCVVVMEWDMPAYRGLPLDTYRMRIPVAEDVPVLEKQLRVDKDLYLENLPSSDYVFDLFYQEGAPPIVCEKQLKDGFLLVTWKGVPAASDPPFGNERRDPTAPFASIGLLRNFAAGGTALEYWAAAARDYLFLPMSEKGGNPPAYKALLKSLKKELPQDTDAAMRLVVRRFHEAVQDLTLPHPDQSRKQVSEDLYGDALGTRIYKAYQLGCAPRQLQPFMFYKLCLDLDLPFYVFIAPNLYEEAFDPEERNAAELNWGDMIFGYPDGDEARLIMPHQRAYPYGTIPDRYRHVNCLMVDVRARRILFRQMPGDAAEHHRDRRTYTMNLTDDGRLTMALTHMLEGAPSVPVRSRYFPLSAGAQAGALRAAYADAMPEWTVDGAGFDSIYDLETAPTYHVTASIALSTEGDVLRLPPFPGSRPSLYAPSYWPENRGAHLYMSQPTVEEDICVLTLPPGYRSRGDDSWAGENGLGKVSVTVTREGDTLTVKRHVSRTVQVADKAAEPLLKQFIDWERAAYAQQLALVKEGAR